MTQTMTVQEYLEIKARLTEAQELERAAREMLVARSGHTKKGSKTVKLDGYKVAITNTVNASIYEPGLDEAKVKLGDRFHLAFKTKFEPNNKGWKELTPAELEIAEEAVITKAGTSQVKIGDMVEE